MRGEFIGVWSESWREIWLPLIDHEGVPEDILCALAPGRGSGELQLCEAVAVGLQSGSGPSDATL